MIYWVDGWQLVYSPTDDQYVAEAIIDGTLKKISDALRQGLSTQITAWGHNASTADGLNAFMVDFIDEYVADSIIQLNLISPPHLV
mmetsp:Transcript_13800/g.32640  ORF Transcript_13800/g.32640 Transcript_13800/m.32640 type:complete len:86 (+) Transcript_13800:668-925(+)